MPRTRLYCPLLNITVLHCPSLHQVLLPEGYPSSVSKDYLEYQLWDTLQVLSDSQASRQPGMVAIQPYSQAGCWPGTVCTANLAVSQVWSVQPS